MIKKTLITFVAIWLFTPVAAFALSSPTEDTLLWVSGNINQSNSTSGVEFDEPMLSQLEMGVIRTNNHVVEDIVEYKGPYLASLLDKVGAQGESVKVIAWDDYMVSIPISDIKKYQVILATHENGQKMTLDDKGPFFVVFPFSDFPELRNDFYYSLSVWQVREIVVE
ncbi:molybdopterin-dependent oxidoreductase [Vibrio pacinii]|uniref:molybdopterin-dependent oxidoreductase n=1 Tax=Vibrio pacinii TaxID=170674 RepID=UPI000AFC1D77|nr:molybdopterin-dependent oxidoreductase [Vibrio pacinii]